MKVNKKLIAFAAMAVTLGIFTLSGCGTNSGEAETTTPAVSSDTSAETAEITSEAKVSETTVSETSSAPEATETSEETTEETKATEAETLPVPVTPSAPDLEKFRFYNAEVKSGYPEICDIESIKARQKNDVENFYNTEFALGGYEINTEFYSNEFELDMITPIYETSTYKYIEDDMDYDGRNEYYLIVENQLDYSNLDPDTLQMQYSDCSASLTIYYIENSGDISFVYFMNNVFSRSSDDPLFFSPVPKYYIVDYGDCKHMIKWYWPAIDGLGGSGFATLFDRNRFFELPIGGVSEEHSNEQKKLVAGTYTWVDEYVWDGSDYTAYQYAYEEKNENGEWVEVEDYHDITREDPEKLKWYYGE